jgi:predicted aspartyl protease
LIARHQRGKRDRVAAPELDNSRVDSQAKVISKQISDRYCKHSWLRAVACLCISLLSVLSTAKPLQSQAPVTSTSQDAGKFQLRNLSLSELGNVEVGASHETRIPFTYADDGRMWADVKINGHVTHALIDTGASIVTVEKGIYLGGSQNRQTITMADGHTTWLNTSNQEVCFANQCLHMNVAQGSQNFSVIPMVLLNHWKSVTFDTRSHTIVLN